MIDKTQKSPISFQRGVALLESLIAILIFSFGVLGIVGLQASMIRNTTDAKYRSEASFIAQNRIGLIWADPGNIANYVETDTDISTILPGGKRNTSQPAVGQVVVEVTWQLPGETQEHNLTNTARIVGG